VSRLSRYEQEAARLAELPRAERFASLLSFPLDFTFKVIGRGPDFWREVRQLLDARGHEQVILVERPSANGRFCSITFSLHITDADALDAYYGALQALPNLVYLL
jgi:putative lipoic acid-binding regulatory protein